MSHFERHLFFCLNQRQDGRASCADHPATQLHAYCKERIKALGRAGPGQVRVNQAGCLDRCEHGPVAVVYPEGIWYTYVDAADIDEIIEQHVQQGIPVARLQIDPPETP